MWELTRSGGILMLPIILCSVLMLAIVIERFISLRSSKILPQDSLLQVEQWVLSAHRSPGLLQALSQQSPLGAMLVAGVSAEHLGRDGVRDVLEITGRRVAHDMSRFLDALGTIATITPLLGLLGTVVGMIRIFYSITEGGIGNPSALAGGIAEALMTTAAGMSVAIPAVIFYRYFNVRVDEMVHDMELQALRLLDILFQPEPVYGREQR